MTKEKVIHAKQEEILFNELCALKFIHHRSDFLRKLARSYYKDLPPVVLQITLPEVEE